MEEETAAPESPSREMEEPSSTLDIAADSSTKIDETSSPVAPETVESTSEKELPEEQATGLEESPIENPEAAANASDKEKEDEAEPFADILENKDKKRYSSQPLPQQSTEQTS